MKTNTMDCNDALPLVEKLFDGEASVLEKTRVEVHLETCVSCRAHRTFLERVTEVSREIVLPEPPGAYWEALPRKVTVRLEGMSVKQGFWSSFSTTAWTLRAGALVAAALAVAVGIRVLDSKREPGETFNASREIAVQESKPDSPEPQEARSSRPSRPSAAPPTGSSSGDVDLKDEIRLAERGRAAPPAPAPTPQETRADRSGERDEPVATLEVDAFDKGRGSAKPTKKEELEKNAETAGRTLDARRKAGALSVEESSQKSIAAGKVSTDTMAESERQSPVAVSEAENRYQFLLGQRQQPNQAGAQARLQSSLPASIEAQVSDLSRECASWRAFLVEFPESERTADALFTLAQCSIRLDDLRPTERTRKQALDDAGMYLKAYPQGERADEIRRALARSQAK